LALAIVIRITQIEAIITRITQILAFSVVQTSAFFLAKITPF
jgi:hypothetical protein